ncbi:hypothetical protein LCGC14_2602490 [marine sediment metagenome]|uniref:Uncharacterized protein n=1 Tax=marine sediment metagenome TaxID=412755 RepID=A0A0F9D129_9ZZZZ
MARPKYKSVSEFNGGLIDTLVHLREFTNDLDNFVNGESQGVITGLDREMIVPLLTKIKSEIFEIEGFITQKEGDE